MTALTGVIIGHQVRKAEERRKLDQEQAQQSQQIRQQASIYIPDQFVLTSQALQPPLSRPH